MEGTWNAGTETSDQLFLSAKEGMFEIKIRQREGIHNFTIILRIKDGEYADDGLVYFQFHVNNTDWETLHEKGKVTVFPKN